MSEVKAHKCPSCGGNLNINVEKQMYHCPFCGSTYDYEYFREDQMHEMGKIYLSRGEFSAAIDAYKYLLQKDHHDFLALRGTMLASARMKDIEALRKPDNFKRVTYNSKLAESVIESSADNDKGYFEEFGRLISEMHELSKLYKEHENLLVEKTRTDSKLSMANATLAESSFTDDEGRTRDPKFGFAVMCVVTGILALVTTITLIVSIFSAIFGGEDSAGFLLAFLGGLVTFGVAMATFKLLYPLAQSVKNNEATVKKYTFELADITQKVEDMEKDIHSRESSVKHACLLFYKEDEKRMEEFNTAAK